MEGGFSSISVMGDRLFSMVLRGDEEAAVCLKTGDGAPLWETAIGQAFFDHQGGNGPRATPALDGERVFVLGARGMLAALSMDDGEPLWRHDLTQDFAGVTPSWGYCASPLVVGNLLLVETGATRAPSLYALNKKDGTVVWRARPGKSGYASPIVVDIEDRALAVFFTGTHLVGLDTGTGSELWNYLWKTAWGINATTPIFYPPDRFFISSNYGKGAALIRVSPKAGSFGVEEVWKSGELNSHFGTAVLYRDHVYGFDNAVLKCVRISDGSSRWQTRGMGKGNLIVADGKLIVLSERGQLVLARADSGAFETLGSAQVLEGRCWTAPSLARGRLYVRNERMMACVALGKDALPVPPHHAN